MSLSQPYGEVDKGQLGFLNSGHTKSHPPFCYIYTPISPFQRTQILIKNPSRNYSQIIIEHWLHKLLEGLAIFLSSRTKKTTISLSKILFSFTQRSRDKQTTERPVKKSFQRLGRHKGEKWICLIVHFLHLDLLSFYLLAILVI